MKAKVLWAILLIIVAILFVYAFFVKEITLTIIALVLAILVQKFGYDTLFSDYDRKREEKLEKKEENN